MSRPFNQMPCITCINIRSVIQTKTVLQSTFYTILYFVTESCPVRDLFHFCSLSVRYVKILLTTMSFLIFSSAFGVKKCEPLMFKIKQNLLKFLRYYFQEKMFSNLFYRFIILLFYLFSKIYFILVLFCFGVYMFYVSKSSIHI